MTIAQIKYFITTAKCLSISKAAEQLYVSQPALSRHIQNIEREYNIQLFVRTAGGIRLTPKNKHPNVDLLLHTASFDKLVSGVYSGSLDMAFTVQFSVADRERIIYQYVSRSRDHIVMTKFHPLAGRERVTLEDVKDETFVMISREDNPQSSPLIFEICKEHGFVPKVIYAKTLAEQILWVEAGVGITILDSRD